MNPRILAAISTAILLLAGDAFAVMVIEDACTESEVVNKQPHKDVDVRDDVDMLSAYYDKNADSLEVCAILCGFDNECKPKTQYRFRLDYDASNGMASELLPEDRDEDSCGLPWLGNPSGETMDATVRFVCGDDGHTYWKVTGPAESCTPVDPGTGQFCCTIFVDQLVREDGSVVQQCDAVDLWIDVQDSGIRDRVPDTSNADGCWEPTGIDEVLPYVLDETPPEITCPTDLHQECSLSTDPDYTLAATAEDDCDADPVIRWTDTIAMEGSCPQNFTITREWSAIDIAGNLESCAQIIQVSDTTPPVISCPADIVRDVDPPALVPVEYGLTASDNCDAALEAACTHPSGYEFGPGETPVTCTATDACGNSASCQFNVTVNFNNETEACFSSCDGAYNAGKANCSNTYNNQMAQCASQYTACDTACDSDYAAEKASCQASYDGAMASCESQYTSCYNSCDQNYDNAVVACEGFYDTAVAACNSSYIACSASCADGDEQCLSECGDANSHCISQAGRDRSGCLNGASSERSSCRSGCGSEQSDCSHSASMEKGECMASASFEHSDCSRGCSSDRDGCEHSASDQKHGCDYDVSSERHYCDENCEDYCEAFCSGAHDVDLELCDREYAQAVQACDSGDEACLGAAAQDRSNCEGQSDSSYASCRGDCH